MSAGCRKLSVGRNIFFDYTCRQMKIPFWRIFELKCCKKIFINIKILILCCKTYFYISILIIVFYV